MTPIWYTGIKIRQNWGKENQISKTQTVCLNTFIIKHFSYGL